MKIELIGGGPAPGNRGEYLEFSTGFAVVPTRNRIAPQDGRPADGDRT
jgi:hypothetical protein